MENQPKPPDPDATERDSIAPADSSTSPVSPVVRRAVEPDPPFETAEPSDDRSTEKQEKFENPIRDQRALDAAQEPAAVPTQDNSQRHSQRTPVEELLRLKNGHFRIRRFEDTGNTINSAIGTDAQTEFDCTLPFAVYKSLRLPTGLIGLKESNSAREMFDCVHALIQHHGMLSEQQSRLITYWSIAGWFTDFLPFIPTLVITGPAFAADPLLRILQCVCRRPVLLAGISPASLREITCNQVMPTLLIRAPQLNKAMAALLDASNQPGYFVSSGKNLWQFYGAKCIYLGEDGNPQIVGPRSIHVHARGNALELGRSFPTNEVVQDLQNQLLFYRIAQHDEVASSTFRVTGFLPELCAMAQVLGAPLTGDPELQKGIIELLKDLNEQVRTDRSCGLSAMVLRAVLWHCHQPDQQQVFVREIAAKANDFYREEGDSFRVSNEIVGHTLKNLGLYTRRLGNAGRGLSLDKATQKRAHELAYTNEVLPNGDDAPACGHCHSRQIQETTEVV